jgi:hypothetical protein
MHNAINHWLYRESFHFGVETEYLFVDAATFEGLSHRISLPDALYGILELMWLPILRPTV